MTDTLTQRARDAAGRLKRREIRGDGMVIASLPPSSEAIVEAAAIISELVGRIEGLEREAMIDKGSAKMRVIGERLVTSYQSELDRINAPSVLGKQEGEG